MYRQIKLKISDFTVCTLLRVDNISIFAEEFDNLKRAVEIGGGNPPIFVLQKSY